MTCTMLAVMLQVTLSETTPLKGTALARSVRLSTLLLSAECACRPVCWSAAIPALCSECISFFELLSVHAEGDSAGPLGSPIDASAVR
jgi:hypothetical protein